jgi:hypothetical protein
MWIFPINLNLQFIYHRQLWMLLYQNLHIKIQLIHLIESSLYEPRIWWPPSFLFLMSIVHLPWGIHSLELGWHMIHLCFWDSDDSIKLSMYGFFQLNSFNIYKFTSLNINEIRHHNYFLFIIFHSLLDLTILSIKYSTVWLFVLLRVHLRKIVYHLIGFHFHFAYQIFIILFLLVLIFS